MTTARQEKPSVPTPDAAEVATANPDAGMWLIATIKHGFMGDDTVFWAADRCGYTSIVDRAGRYTKEEADEICAERHPSLPRERWALRATDVVSATVRVLRAEQLWELTVSKELLP